MKNPQQSLKDWGDQNGAPKVENHRVRLVSGIFLRKQSSR